ncbi:MAG: formate/nitrite transporter family protein [Kineosporiaceae bacterium]
MSFETPDTIAAALAASGRKKLDLAWPARAALGFLGGAFIAFGYLLALKVTAGTPKEWGGVVSLIGASVFPLGLILVLLAGAELVTGSMAAVVETFLARRAGAREVAVNLLVITGLNAMGALFVAVVFGHVGGLTTSGPLAAAVTDAAGHKLAATTLQSFVSGIGCNWLVCLAVWLSLGARDTAGRILGIWFPTMAFVAIGFQHSVANMFLLPAAALEGAVGWGHALANVATVWCGNLVGGAVFVAGLYGVAYLRRPHDADAGADVVVEAVSPRR